jgi:hypothetical protein
VLAAIEPFFLDRGEEFAVANDRGRRIPVICVYSEYDQDNSPLLSLRGV